MNEFERNRDEAARETIADMAWEISGRLPRSWKHADVKMVENAIITHLEAMLVSNTGLNCFANLLNAHFLVKESGALTVHNQNVLGWTFFVKPEDFETQPCEG